MRLYLCFYRLRRDRCDPSKSGEDASALEGGMPALVGGLHAALYAIEVRAPAEVRKTARHLLWPIVGFPSDPDSLYMDGHTEGLNKSDHAEILLSHIFGLTPVDPSPSGPSIYKLRRSPGSTDAWLLGTRRGGWKGTARR
ncbi:hypothetical protein ACFXI8_23635 [Streptomyces niveus]|uniref:hypothetical protein n=1 Tax=Streptomyces niveus TaxID=193462 RepID=UPI00367DBB4B